jgi:hypothetical protein
VGSYGSPGGDVSKGVGAWVSVLVGVAAKVLVAVGVRAEFVEIQGFQLVATLLGVAASPGLLLVSKIPFQGGDRVYPRLNEASFLNQ